MCSTKEESVAEAFRIKKEKCREQGQTQSPKCANKDLQEDP